MKKTIIALAALSGSVFATETEGSDYGLTLAEVAATENWIATFTSSDKTTAQSWDDYSAKFGADCPLTLTITSMNTTGTGSNDANYPNGEQATAIRPNTNVGNGGTWEITFKLKNNGSDTITLSAITFDAFAYNSGGGAQNKDCHQRDMTFTLSGDITGTVEHSFTNVNKDGKADEMTVNDEYHWNDNPKFTLSSPVELAADSTLTFKLKVQKSTSQGSFVGISGATFTGQVVPEPTTATLSLLALAGLAARRRRK